MPRTPEVRFDYQGNTYRVSRNRAGVPTFLLATQDTRNLESLSQAEQDFGKRKTTLGSDLIRAEREDITPFMVGLARLARHHFPSWQTFILSIDFKPASAFMTGELMAGKVRDDGANFTVWGECPIPTPDERPGPALELNTEGQFNKNYKGNSGSYLTEMEVHLEDTAQPVPELFTQQTMRRAIALKDAKALAEVMVAIARESRLWLGLGWDRLGLETFNEDGKVNFSALLSAEATRGEIRGRVSIDGVLYS